MVHAGFIVAGGEFAPEGIADEDVDDSAGLLLVGPVVHFGDYLFDFGQQVNGNLLNGLDVIFIEVVGEKKVVH